MLSYLHIKNIALISELSLSLNAGLIAFTGETGAGKSIVLDALQLILGGRADSQVIRYESDEAEVAAHFNIHHRTDIVEWLKDRSLHTEDMDCVVRRQLFRQQASRAFINNHLVPAQTLRELGEFLLLIHGQHECQRLLSREGQRQVLDNAADMAAPLKELRAIYQDWKHLADRIKELQNHRDRDLRLEFLQFALTEYRALQLVSNEHATLLEERKSLSQRSALHEAISQALHWLEEAEPLSLLQALHHAESSVNDFKDHPDLHNTMLLFQQLDISVQELGADLHGLLRRAPADPERLQAIEERLSAIHTLARKHRMKPEDLDAHFQALEEEWAELEQSGSRLALLEKERELKYQEYLTLALRISAKRRKTATALAKKVEASLHELAMPMCMFEILCLSDESILSPHGIDTIEFLIAPNPGQPKAPLSKIASGGELSRASLAISVNAEVPPLPTMIFDEIDAGVGGSVAAQIGKLLSALGHKTQVLSVTHAPQIAALADTQWAVEKTVKDNMTSTSLRLLAKTERVEEIARMLGGLKISNKTREHAEALIASREELLA